MGVLLFKGVWVWGCYNGRLQFPLPAGGTEHAPCLVPLAKRGEPAGGGQFMNSARAIGIIRERPREWFIGCHT
jgi:hypothetical protein